MNLAVAGILTAATLLLGIGGFLYFTQEEPLTLSFNVSATPKTLSPGQNVEATFTTTTNRNAPINLNYTLVSRQGQIIFSDRQSFLTEGTIARTINIPIPVSAPPGPYWLRVRAQSGSVSTVALASIAIIQPPAKPRGAPSRNATSIPINITLIQPNLTIVQPNITFVQPQAPSSTIPSTPPSTQPQSLSPGPAPLSTEETIQNAKTTAAANPAAAADICKSIKAPDTDTCYSEAALAARNGPGAEQAGSICMHITESSSKDACLVNLALAGDFSVCDAITNIDIKDSCNALKGKSP